MKNAPELHYAAPAMSAGDNSVWMTSQLLRDVNATADKPFKEDQLYLIPDITEPGKPTYSIWYTRDDGMQDFVRRNDGRVMKWHPDWSKAPERAVPVERYKEGRERLLPPPPPTTAEEMEQRRQRQ